MKIIRDPELDVRSSYDLIHPLSFTLRCYYTHPETRAEVTTCHLHIKNGKIEFCGDCPHDRNGQTVDLPDFPEGYSLPEPNEVIL